MHAEKHAELVEERSGEQRDRYLVYHDPVTGMPNRSYFQETVDQWIHQFVRQRYGVMMLDLDGFSAVNEIAGHEAGDCLLKKVSAEIAVCIGGEGILANAWGDRFLLGIPNLAKLWEISRLAEKILHKCRRPWTVNGYEFPLTASIGISVYPDDGSDCAILMKNADLALRIAKKSGKDNYQLYTPYLESKVLAEVELVKKLHQALGKREFFLEYQPRMSLFTQQIVSFEALIRWHSPSGLMYPGSFIPLAEEKGLISEIGAWVLEEACRQLKEWDQAGMDIAVSINISPSQLYQKNFAAFMQALVQRYELQPEKIELEVTEGTVMKQMDLAIQTIKNIKKAGIKIAMDDFGTGYSSLTNLKNLPIDTLKIDKSFIQDFEKSAESKSIAKAIVTLGHILKLNVTAEGVETEEALQLLRTFGCDEIQGYFLSRPVAMEQAYEMLVGQKKRARELQRMVSLDSSAL